METANLHVSVDFYLDAFVFGRHACKSAKFVQRKAYLNLVPILMEVDQVCNTATDGHTNEQIISPFNDKGSVKQKTLCAWACPGHAVGKKLSSASTHIHNALGSFPVKGILQAQSAALQTMPREVCHGM